MSIGGRILRFFTGYNGPIRQDGYQMSVPLHHSGPAAAAVNFDTAMSVSAFWASARLLSETVAAMPIKCYRAENGGRSQDTNYRLWRLLNYQPNRYQTRTEFFETVMLNLVTTGNSYCALERNARNEVVSIMPLMASQMDVELLDDGTVTYRYYSGDGDVRVFAAESIWHVKLFGNGVVGMSPLAYARNSLGIAIASADRASTLAKSGGKTNGILMVDKLLTPEQRATIRKNMAGLTDGGADKLFVLEADMKFERTSLSPQDMQLLETRRFQIEDVARFMGVPSVLINDTSGTTAWGSGIQQIMEGFYKLNLRPYLERLESSLKRHMMPRSDWDTVDIEFDFDALLRADRKTRAEAARAEVNAGLLTPNEGRSEEGRPPKEGGDDIYLNGSLVPAGRGQDNGSQTPAASE